MCLAIRSLGFFPTTGQAAIPRISQGRPQIWCQPLEVIHQRPGELDRHPVASASTVFACGCSNDHDQEIIASAISHSSASTHELLSSIGNGEAIVLSAKLWLCRCGWCFERVPEGCTAARELGLAAGSPRRSEMTMFAFGQNSLDAGFRHIDDYAKPQPLPGGPRLKHSNRNHLRLPADAIH